MSRPKIWVARHGSGLDTAPIYKRTLDSTKNHLKRYLEGSGTATLPANAGGIGLREYIPIVHNLGYKPYIRAFVFDEVDNIWKLMPNTIKMSASPSDPAIFCGISYGDNETVLNFYTLDDPFTGAYSAVSIEYKYIIYIDPAIDVWTS